MSGKRFAPRIDAALLLGLLGAMWIRLLVLRVLLNTAMQGAVFLNPSCLPATTTNRLFSFTTIKVRLLGVVVLGERPTVAQWAGVDVHLFSELVN